MTTTTIELNYDLSESAMRSELGAGRPAHKARAFALEPTPALAAIASIDPKSGSATIAKRETRYSWQGVDRYGTGRIEHESDRVIASQEDALAWLDAQERLVAAKCDEARAAHETAQRESAARDAALCAERSAAVMAMSIDDSLPRADAWRLSDDAAARLESLREEQAQRNAARKAAEAAALASQKDDVRGWAAENATARLGDATVSRAAREGRDVAKAVDDLVSQRVEAALECITAPAGFAVGVVYSTEERTGVPSPRAYELLDLLGSGASVAALTEAAGLPHVVIKIGPICRYDVAAQGSAVWRTGVEVTIEHPWLVGGKTTWSVLAEPAPAAGDDESED